MTYGLSMMPMTVLCHVSVVPPFPEEQIANSGSQDVTAGATAPPTPPHPRRQTTESAGCPPRNTLPFHALVFGYYTCLTFRI